MPPLNRNNVRNTVSSIWADYHDTPTYKLQALLGWFPIWQRRDSRWHRFKVVVVHPDFHTSQWNWDTPIACYPLSRTPFLILFTHRSIFTTWVCLKFHSMIDHHDYSNYQTLGAYLHVRPTPVVHFPTYTHEKSLRWLSFCPIIPWNPRKTWPNPHPSKHTLLSFRINGWRISSSAPRTCASWYSWRFAGIVWLLINLGSVIASQ